MLIPLALCKIKRVHCELLRTQGSQAVRCREACILVRAGVRWRRHGRDQGKMPEDLGNTLFSAGAHHASPVSQVVAGGLRPGGWRWVVAESGKVVMWVPMAHPGRSRTLLWYREPHQPWERQGARKDDRSQGGRKPV